MVERDLKAMIAQMQPELTDGEYVFCTTKDADLAAQVQSAAIGLFREREGTTLILPVGLAEQHGFDAAMPMRLITLNVYSALDGVGLTAAVSSALADAGIPCNIVAAFHHDHIFVPSRQAARALELLTGLSTSRM